MKKIDELINNITMYRLVIYSLLALVGLGVVFAFIGRLSFSPPAMILSLLLLTGSAYCTEKLFSYMWNRPSNMGSAFITALILFLILQPASSLASALVLVLAGTVSSASKYILAWKGKHVFNPAAIAAAFLSLSALSPATWWIGSGAMWPFALLFGLIVVRKIRRFPMVIVFFVFAIVVQILVLAVDGHPILSSMPTILFASPLIFLATIMLTEPATMPPRRNQQMVFAGIVAALYVTAWKVGPIYIYPEVALLIGNVYAFIVSPKFKVAMRLAEIKKISDNVYSYAFEPQQKFNFLPGQYMEWTLAKVPYDSRGNRRSFTIASSPTESTVQVGLKYYNPSSAYKRRFKSLQVGDTVYASQLSGDFTMNGHETQKLAFIAGGIGITPFRSMVKYIVDKQMKSDITVLYAVSDEKELAYVDEFKAAAAYGVRLVPITSQAYSPRDGVYSAKLDDHTIKAAIPDYQERIFYISGPNQMVVATKKYLLNLSVAPTRIRSDHFAGY